MRAKKGSITVEAVFIIPIVIFVILALCYMTFYMRDKVKIEKLLNQTAEKSSLFIKRQRDFATEEIQYENINSRSLFYIIKNLSKEKIYIEEYLKEQLKQNLLLGELEYLEIEITSMRVQIKTYISIHIGIFYIQKYFTKTGLLLCQEAQVQVYRPEEFVRAYTTINESLSQSNGYRKIKEYLEKIQGIIKNERRE